jgi:hypothetical protein
VPSDAVLKGKQIFCSMTPRIIEKLVPGTANDADIYGEELRTLVGCLIFLGLKEHMLCKVYYGCNTVQYLGKCY